MKSITPVKMLSALALVLLAFSATEGRILSKCELKQQLDAAQFKQITAMEEKVTVSNLIARLVCKANSSAFNTSFVKAVTVSHKEKKPAQRPTLLPPQAPSKKPSHPHAQALTRGAQGSGRETALPQLNASAVGQLFGVFQLSDQIACDSGVMPSLNACNISCSALIDDDISNDIACLKTLMDGMKPKPREKPTIVKNILDALLVKECRSVVPSKYFADCA